MPIPLPNLDDRTFADLVQEMRALIPRYAPIWTDHNASDPGIMLIELFAWLAESQIYRLNRIPTNSESRYLEMLGAVFNPARPAEVKLKVMAEGLTEELILPKNTPLRCGAGNGSGTMAFETVHDLRLTAEAFEGSLLARQTALVLAEQLGVSDGSPHQSFTLAKRFPVLQPEGSFALVPVVKVDSAVWDFKNDLLNSGPQDRHFTFEPRLSAVRFGNGRPQEKKGTGLIPPEEAVIYADYRYTLGQQGNLQQAQNFTIDQDSDFLDPLVIQALDSGVSFSILAETGASGGADPTDLDEARSQAIRLLKNRVRAITAEDFKQLVLDNTDFNIARAHCLPEKDLTILDQDSSMPGHVSVIVVSRPTVILHCSDLIKIVRFSPDSKKLVSAGDCHIRIWDLDGNGNEVIIPPRILVRDIEFSPDGRQLAIISPFRTAAIWDAEQGKRLHVLHHKSYVNVAAFSPNGRQLATAGDDRSVRVWDTESGEQLHLLSHTAPVNDVIFSPDGHGLATASDDRTARLWNAQTGAEIFVFNHESPVKIVSFSPDSRLVATAGDDNFVRVWATDSGEQSVILAHDAPVGDLCFTPDSKQLATHSSDNTARLWLIEAHEELSLLRYPESAIAPVLSRNANFSATVGDNNVARGWDIRTGKEIAVFHHSDKVDAMACNSDGTRLVTASGDGRIRIWPAAYLRKIEAFLDERRLITCRHHVVNASFTDVRVKTEVIGHPKIEIGALKGRIQENLRDFFHPLTGGPGSHEQGWPFGRDVYASEVYQVIEGTEGVDHVEALSLATRHSNGDWIETGNQVTIAPQSLVHFDLQASEIKVMTAISEKR
jgi:WD40 repeat protein